GPRGPGRGGAARRSSPPASAAPGWSPAPGWGAGPGGRASRLQAEPGAARPRAAATAYAGLVADELKPAYLIAGTDRPKIDRAVERLRGRFARDAVEIHQASEVGGADAVAACNALGLFASVGRLIVVEGVEEWKAPDAK